MELTIDQVTDNGDNSLTIIGHDTEGTSYTTSNGRKNALPIKDEDQQAYYRITLEQSIPAQSSVLYQNPNYTPPVEVTDKPNKKPKDVTPEPTPQTALDPTITEADTTEGNE